MSFNTPDFSGLKILVADDDEINRDIIRNMLEVAGASVSEADDGLFAYEIITEYPDSVDVILMDIEMPVMDGYTAAKKIREAEKNGEIKKGVPVPIIAVTGDEPEDFMYRSAGFSAYVMKPINPETIYNAINKLK